MTLSHTVRDIEKLAGNVTDGPFIEDPDVSTSICHRRIRRRGVQIYPTKEPVARVLERDPPDGTTGPLVLKTLAAFLNSNGGKLIIGVADDGTPVGIERRRL